MRILVLILGTTSPVLFKFKFSLDAKTNGEAKIFASDPLSLDLQATVQEEIFSFKEKVANGDFWQPPSDTQMSWEENGKTLGSLFAHDSYNHLQNQIFYNPKLAQEIRDLHAQYTFYYSNSATKSIICC